MKFTIVLPYPKNNHMTFPIFSTYCYNQDFLLSSTIFTFKGKGQCFSTRITCENVSFIDVPSEEDRQSHFFSSYSLNVIDLRKGNMLGQGAPFN